MNKASKVISIGLIFSFILSISLLFTGCGDDSANLKEYVNNHEELLKELESYSTEGVSITVNENTLTYTYEYDKTFDSSTAKYMASELKKKAATLDSTFEYIRDTLIEETGFSDIVVKIVYTDNKGTVLYEKEY